MLGQFALAGTGVKGRDSQPGGCESKSQCQKLNGHY